MTASSLSPVWISIKTSACATLLAFVAGLAAAHAVSEYRGKWRGLLDGVLILPLVLPPTVVGFFLLLLFGRRSVVGQALEYVGFPIAFSWPGTVIAAAVVAFPLMYRTALGAFEQVSPNVLGAARTLGAGEWRIFRQVLLPLAGPGVLAGTVLAFARALGEFGATLMLAGNIPGRTQTMPIAIFFAADSGDMAQALRWAALLVAMSLASVVMLNAASTRRAPAVLQEVEGPLPGGRGSVSVSDRQGADLAVEIQSSYAGFKLSVSFSARGGTLGVLGASGSGKTMTLRSIAGLERPDSGRIVLNGRVLFDSARGICLPPAARRVGLVFQDYALFPHMTVAGNIGFGLADLPEAERRRRVLEWAAVVRLEKLLDCYPGQLSGGQRQRVALARALAMEPEALLLDEPLSALDSHLRRQMEAQLRDILGRYRGVSVLVTHDRDEAFRLSENLLVLHDGRVAAGGPRQDLFANPKTVAAARITGCKNLARFQTDGPGRIRVAEWNCMIETAGAIPEGASFAGIRAHHIRLTTESGGRNTFACWLVSALESPFETTLYLSVGSPGAEPHVEAEVSREEWALWERRPQPWHVRIEPESILLLRDG